MQRGAGLLVAGFSDGAFAIHEMPECVPLHALSIAGGGALGPAGRATAARASAAGAGRGLGAVGGEVVAVRHGASVRARGRGGAPIRRNLDPAAPRKRRESAAAPPVCDMRPIARLRARAGRLSPIP